MTIVAKALPLWELEKAETTRIALRENAVYRVDHNGTKFALRLHRQGYRSDAQLVGELDWMACLARSNIRVPTPLPSLAGPTLQHVQGVQVDVLTWLEGETLEHVLPKLSPARKRNLFHQLGQTMAHLHEASDRWVDAKTCNRPSWDLQGLLGESPLWDRFWENPALTAAQKALFCDFRTQAAHDLDRLGPALDYGLIHADLVPANVMVDQDAINLIDFDDGGYGFRLFEIATALLKLRADPDYALLQDALLNGYLSLKSLKIAPLALFLALRATTYVGWNITRMHEDKTGTRNDRFIAQAQTLIQAYNAQKQS